LAQLSLNVFIWRFLLNIYSNFDRQITALAQKYNLSEEHIVFYGNHRCAEFEGSQYGYKSLLENSKITKKYCFHMGCTDHNIEVTLQGRQIEMIAVNGWYDKKRSVYNQKHNLNEGCKAALVNIVLENYKRIQEGHKVIPVLFTVNSNTLPKNGLNLDDVCKRTLRGMTTRELRRCYKLSSAEELTRNSAHNKELFTLATSLAQVAAQTFHLVSIDSNGSSLELNEQPLFWQRAEWKEGWQERMDYKEEWLELLGRNSTDMLKSYKPFPWRNELLRRADSWNKSTVGS
jgi:hypothetical protein